MSNKHPKTMSHKERMNRAERAFSGDREAQHAIAADRMEPGQTVPPMPTCAMYYAEMRLAASQMTLAEMEQDAAETTASLDKALSHP